jgi:hypothetical protein
MRAETVFDPEGVGFDPGPQYVEIAYVAEGTSQPPQLLDERSSPCLVYER